MENTEKYCVNCAFYVPHYIIMSERLCMTSGHCKNTLRTRKKILYPEETCAEWRAKTESNRREGIEGALARVERQLRDIKYILKLSEE